MKIFETLVAVSGYMVLCISAQASLVVPNGDFEAPVEPHGVQTFLAVGARIETASHQGWTVIGNVDTAGVNIHHVSADGLWNNTQFLDLTGNTSGDPSSFGGVQSDALATIAGQVYTVTFDAMNGSTVWSSGGPFSGNAFSLKATGGPLVSYNLTAGQIANSLTYTFTAAGSDTLTFQDLTGFDSNAGWIDNVSIALIPEPTTMIAGALLLLAFGASTLRILRRNRAA